MTAQSAPARRPRSLAAAVAAIVGLALLVAAAPAPAGAAVQPPQPRRIVSGWLPYWTSSSSLAAVLPNADLFTDVSPFWYSATWAGGTSAISQQVSSSSRLTMTTQLRAAGVKVLPTLTDGMPAHKMAAVMADPKARATFISRLVSLAVVSGYDGLDLDFEKFAFSDGSSTWATTRPSWVTFVAQLSAALHARGKILSVTTPPIYNAARSGSSGYWVYDWAGIGRYVDRLRIMAYDYSWSTPGPIGPFGWTERIVQFAVTQVPSGKVQIGVASYGRDWVRRTSTNAYSVTGTCPTSNPPSFSKHEFDADMVPSVLASRGIAASGVHWDPVSREHWARYDVTFSGTTGATKTSCVVHREMWWQDSDSVVARAALVATYQLAGVVEWTIGGEDARQWARLRAYARTIAPVPTVATISVPTVATYGAAPVVSARAMSAGLPVQSTVAVLYFRPTGGTRWSEVGRSTTSSAGTVSFRPTVGRSGTYRVLVTGTFDRAPAAAWRNLAARPSIALTTSATRVRAGAAVTLRAAIGPARSGLVVHRLLRVGSRWVVAGTARTGASGVVVFRVTPPSPHRSYRYRIDIPAQHGFAHSTRDVVVTTR